MKKSVERKLIVSLICIREHEGIPHHSILLHKVGSAWFLPGKEPKPRESHEKCLVRTVAEEFAGARCFPGGYFGSFEGRSFHSGDPIRVAAYFGSVSAGDKSDKITPSAGIDEAYFCNGAETRTLLLSDVTRQIVEALIKNGNLDAR